MNELSISFYGNRRMQSGDDDQRYRISVFLLRDQRPKYWAPHCMLCGKKMDIELSGEVIMLTDLDDLGNYQALNPPVIVKCSGPYCKRWYEFVSLS